MSPRREVERPSNLLANNQIFGYQVLPGEDPSTDIMFGGALPVQKPSSETWGVRLCASPHTSVQSFVSNAQGLCAYVWGMPAHPEVRPSDIPAWCATVVAAEQYNMIVNAMKAGSPVKLRVAIDARYETADTNGYNVIAEIPGTDPRLGTEIVLIGSQDRKSVV